MQSKGRRKFKIQIRGGVVTARSREHLVIMGTDALMYRVDLLKSKQFVGVKVGEGDPVWIYCVPERLRVLTILPQSEQMETPPELDEEVELE